MAVPYHCCSFDISSFFENNGTNYSKIFKSEKLVTVGVLISASCANYIRCLRTDKIWLSSPMVPVSQAYYLREYTYAPGHAVTSPPFPFLLHQQT